MERLIRSMGAGTMAVLDLEDGYLDVRDLGRTSERRASGREQLLELCANAKGRTNGRPVALRVNVAGSEDFMCDLPVVRAVSETFGLASVMLPKVESADQVRGAHAGGPMLKGIFSASQPQAEFAQGRVDLGLYSLMVSRFCT